MRTLFQILEIARKKKLQGITIEKMQLNYERGNMIVLSDGKVVSDGRRG